MKFKNNFFYNYLSNAPTTLAIERSMECEILSRHTFEGPILDIGCGDGLFANILFNQKIDTGVDPDNKEIQRASKYSIYHELINCPGSKIPKDDNFYQTILSNSVLEHIPDVEPVIKEANRLLAPGGNFYTTVPSNYFDKYTFGSQILTFLGCKSLAEKYQRLFNRFWKHYHYYEKEKWKSLFEANGFKVVEKIEYCPKRIGLLESFFIPFAAYSFLLKRLSGKWVLFPSIRKLLVYPLYLLLKKILKGAFPVQNGGIIFFHLTK